MVAGSRFDVRTTSTRSLRAIAFESRHRGCRPTRLRAPLVAKPLEEEQRVTDAPARIGIDPDETLVLGRNLVGTAVPLQESFVEVIRILCERNLEVQSGSRDRLADRFAELGDDDLLRFIDDVNGTQQHTSPTAVAAAMISHFGFFNLYLPDS